MVLKDGNDSAIGDSLWTLIALTPSMLIESMASIPPGTDIFPALSVCTPACVVRVDIALVDPSPRELIPMGRSFSSRPLFVSAMLETSVVIGHPKQLPPD